ncbi:genome polyprotein [Striga asiatica]|uniref:Genome polyprotein n=1 Tax=Striga asiatica TaxID=4170 RepID=A0A5A7NWA1_STRAF|nr:genome polyprotein [Striga asiatica]
MIDFSRLRHKSKGVRDSLLAKMGRGTPMEAKNSSLGKRVWSGQAERTFGNRVTITEMSAAVNPYSLRRFKTASGFSGDFSWSLLEARTAASGANPHELTR